ncbi:MAG: hypothetical protein Q9220_006764 [cf. Caloplaca sp. 1 TL-2023]
MKQTLKNFIILATLFSLSSAWNLTVYSHGTHDCGGYCKQSGSSDFDYVVYTGTGSSGCMEIGKPDSSVQCIWYTDGGTAGPFPCTTPMTSVGSFEVGTNAWCEYNIGAADTGFKEANQGPCGVNFEQQYWGVCMAFGKDDVKSVTGGKRMYFRCSDTLYSSAGVHDRSKDACST